jgi:hypothetical protein
VFFLAFTNRLIAFALDVGRIQNPDVVLPVRFVIALVAMWTLCYAVLGDSDTALLLLILLAIFMPS